MWMVYEVDPHAHTFKLIWELLKEMVHKHQNDNTHVFINQNISCHMFISSFVHLQTVSVESLQSFINEAPDLFIHSFYLRSPADFLTAVTEELAF